MSSQNNDCLSENNFAGVSLCKAVHRYDNISTLNDEERCKLQILSIAIHF